MSFADPEPGHPAPGGWERRDAEWLCLGCRRREIVDAVATGPEGERAAKRRKALAEFELLREPEAPDYLIAKRVSCQPRYIGPIRQTMLDDGRLQ